MFTVIFFGEILFLPIAGKIAKNLNAQKCRATGVSLVYLNFVCFVDSMSLFVQRTIKKIVAFVGEKRQRI